MAGDDTGYDFFRPHAALNGGTPAGAAGLHIWKGFMTKIVIFA